MTQRRRKRNVDATGRSRRSDGPGGWAMLHRWMMRSEAWRDLTPYDRAVYLAVVETYTGHNNGAIGLGVRQAAVLAGVNKDTATRSLARLEAHGFLVRVKEGGFGYKLRHTAEWRLTAYDCDVTGQAATKDFMKWRPETANHGPTTSDSRSDQIGQVTSISDKHVRPDRTVKAA